MKGTLPGPQPRPHTSPDSVPRRPVVGAHCSIRGLPVPGFSPGPGVPSCGPGRGRAQGQDRGPEDTLVRRERPTHVLPPLPCAGIGKSAATSRVGSQDSARAAPRLAPCENLGSSPLGGRGLGERVGWPADAFCSSRGPSPTSLTSVIRTSPLALFPQQQMRTTFLHLQSHEFLWWLSTGLPRRMGCEKLRFWERLELSLREHRRM